MASKQEKAVANEILKVAKDAAKSAAGTNMVTPDAADQRMKALLTQLKMEHQEATLKIKRKQAGGTYALFVTLEGLRLEDVVKYGADTICQEEGGDGTYIIDVFAGGKYQGQIGPFPVAGGIRHEKPRALREKETQNPWGTPVAGLSPMAGAPVQSGPASAVIKDFAGYMNKATEQSTQQNDRLLGMMQMSANQQMQMMQQQQQQQTQMLMALFGSQQQQNQPNSEVEALRQQITQMQQQQQHEQAMRALEAKIDAMSRDTGSKKDDAFMAVLLKSMESGKNDSAQTMAMMTTMMQAMQQSSSTNNETMWKAMSMMMDKPPEDERLRGMMDTMSTGMMNLFSTMGQIAASGLLGGGGKSTVETLVEKAADIVTELGVVAMQRGGEEPSEQMAPPAHVEAPQMPGGPEMQALPEHEAAPMGDLEQPEGSPYDLAADPGLAKIIDLIETNGDPREISARLWAHTQTGHKVSNRWWEDPTEYGYALLQQLQVPYERIEEIIKDILGMQEHLHNGGNPNAWSADAGYLPLKQKRQSVVPMVEHKDGFSQPAQVVEAEIDEGTLYNPNQPPTDVQQSPEIPPQEETEQSQPVTPQ